MNNFIKSLLVTMLLSVVSSSYAVATEDDVLPQALQDILLENANSTQTQDADSTLQDFDTNVNTELDDTALRTYSSKITLGKLNQQKNIEITAGQKEAGVVFTLPVDKVVVSAKLELFVELSEQMALRGSHMAVQINGQEIATLPLNRKEVTDYELEIPSEYLSQENGITFTISDDEEFTCMLDYSGKHKVKIDADSYLILNGYRMDLDSSLALFPLPFIDQFEMGKTTIEYVLPKLYDKSILKAASMLASYFGQEAEYKGVEFKVNFESLPKAHAILFGHPGQKVGGIDLPTIPGVYIKDNPYYSLYKNIYIVAKNDLDFIYAIAELCDPKEQNTLNYIRIKPRELKISEAYDAKKWLPTNRKVYLHELLKDNQSLVTKGFWHSALNLTFRAAPDLYELYEGQGDLFLSYEFPLENSIDENTSGLNISLSGNYVDKLSMNKKGLLENIWKATGGDIRQTQSHIQIPPYKIYGNNNLELYFDLRLKKDTPCQVMQDTNIKSVIDDSSYLDLSHAKHYAKLPNLSFFAGAQFPFTRYADFSHTALLLPNKASASELSMLFDMVARAGNATGNLVYNENIFIGDEVFEDAEKLSGLDLLVVSSLKNKAYLEKLLYKSAFEFNGNELNIHDYGLFSTRGGFISGVKRFLAGDFRPQNIDANRHVRTSLSWRGFLSLISPFDSDNIAVVVTATDEDELSKLSNDLDSDKVNKAIGGDISIISGIDKVEKFEVGDYIYSGDVSTLFSILHFVGEHVFWLSVVAFIIIVLLSFIASVYLQKRAQRRLQEGSYNNVDRL